MRFAFVAVLLLSLVGLYAWADTPVTANQGKPGNQGCWPVCTSGTTTVTFDGGFLGTVNVNFDGGYLGTTAPVHCTTITNSNTSVGVASTAVPAAAQAGRVYATICNSIQNVGMDVVKCRADGVAPVFAAGNAGDVLEEGDCIQYSVNATQSVLCIANNAATNVLGFECTP